MNTNQNIQRFLVNEVTNDKFGLFLEGSVKNLILKKIGITIPATDLTVKVSDYSPGRGKRTFLEYKKHPIVEGETFEAGFNVEKVVENPGTDDDDYKPKLIPYTTRLIATRAMSAGVINDLDVLQIEDELIDLIEGDYDRNKSQCFVKAYRAYVVTDDDNTDASGFKVTLADGTEVTFATASTFAAGQLGLQFNANTTLDDYLIAYRLGADKYMIISKDPFYKFTLSSASDTTIEHRFLVIENLSNNDKVSVEYERNKWTSYYAYQYLIDASTRTTTAFKAYVEGAEVSVTGNSTLATLVGNINTALNTYGIYATYQGTNILIYGPSTLSGFFIVLGDTNTLVISEDVSPKGQFPNLTYEKIFQKFLNRPDDGFLAGVNKYIQRPIVGGIYRLYTFEGKHDNYNFTGPAGNIGKVINHIQLYVLKSEALTDLFKATSNEYMEDETPANPDTSLDDLIQTVLVS